MRSARVEWPAQHLKAVASARQLARVQPLELPRAMAAVELSEAQQVQALPWARQAAVEEQPSAVRVVAAVRPSEVQAELEVPRAAEPAAQPLVAAEVVRPSVQQVVEAVQPLAEQAAQRVVAEEAALSVVQVLPWEARVELPSVEPSARSGLPVPRPARRRWTMSRRTPGPATVERRRSQSSSAEGFECSS